jgi:hypothetical protein
MNRYCRKIDANQMEIVDALTKVGCSVLDCHTVGRGMPDIIVGYRWKNYLLEIKNPAAKGKLNQRQKAWIAGWAGRPVAVVRTVEEALAAVGIEIAVANRIKKSNLQEVNPNG